MVSSACAENYLDGLIARYLGVLCTIRLDAKRMKLTMILLIGAHKAAVAYFGILVD